MRGQLSGWLMSAWSQSSPRYHSTGAISVPVIGLRHVPAWVAVSRPALNPEERRLAIPPGAALQHALAQSHSEVMRTGDKADPARPQFQSGDSSWLDGFHLPPTATAASAGW